MNQIAPLFKKLSYIATPDEISDDEFKLLELFVMRLYSKNCNTEKAIENIPPTKGAPRQHVLRSVLQSLCKAFV